MSPNGVCPHFNQATPSPARSDSQLSESAAHRNSRRAISARRHEVGCDSTLADVELLWVFLKIPWKKSFGIDIMHQTMEIPSELTPHQGDKRQALSKLRSDVLVPECLIKSCFDPCMHSAKGPPDHKIWRPRPCRNSNVHLFCLSQVRGSCVRDAA